MADWYDKTLSKIGKGLLDLDNLSDPKIVPVTANYVFNQAHEFLSDIPNGDRVAPLASMTNVSFGPQVSGPLVDDVFSIDLYTGNGASRSIVNDIDLAGDGGIVWIRDRNSGTTVNHLFSTLRGVEKLMRPNESGTEGSNSQSLTAFNNDGFSLGTASITNRNTGLMVAWTFKKVAKFLDVVEYSGDSVAGKTIAHSLGIKPGFVMVKRFAGGSVDWACQHVSTSGNTKVSFNGSGGALTNIEWWNNTAFDSSNVTLGTNFAVNETGSSYLMYLFAHDPSDDGVIQCGEYTGNGNIVGPIITLGWKPQYVMLREVLSGGVNYVVDTKRGIVNGGDDRFLGLSGIIGSEFDYEGIGLTSDGFQVQTTATDVNQSGRQYIWMAIREAGTGGPTTGAEAWLDADDPIITGPTLDDVIEAFVMLNDTGVEATSPILFYSDEAVGLPFTVQTTGAINVQLSSENGIAKL